MLIGLLCEDITLDPWRRAGLTISMYHGSFNKLLETGKTRLAGDTARAATVDEVRSCTFLVAASALPQEVNGGRHPSVEGRWSWTVKALFP